MTARDEFVARRNAGDLTDEVMRQLIHEIDLEQAALERDSSV